MCNKKHVMLNSFQHLINERPCDPDCRFDTLPCNPRLARKQEDLINSGRRDSESDNIFSDKLGEECGIFGGYCKTGNAAPYVRNGLFKLQHRGQESAGISSGEISQTLHKAKGLVMEVFNENSMMKLPGNFAIGHVRYSTQGGSTSINAQPYLINYFSEDVSIAHNGNIQKAMKMREKFEKFGEVFITSSDSEVLLKRIVYGLKKPPKDWGFDEVGKCINKDFSDGSFSVVFCLPNKIFAYRDSYGYRPLMFCDAKEGYFVASEDVAFCGLEINKIVEIQAGWGVEITAEGYQIKQFATKTNEKKCVFEHIYFANPASNIFGANVYESRIELGKILAKSDGVDADIVVPVMESGFVCALGYSRESGIPLEMGLLRNHWVGRSFIQPTKQSRIDKVRAKLTPIKSIIEGKRIVLIDDSLVRGTTSTEIVKMLRNAGAKEIHFRLASPMLLNTCCWGVDIPTREELIANICDGEEQIAKHIGADSVKYMPFDGLKNYFGKDGWCYNCFTAKLEIGGICKQHTKTPVLV